MKLAPRAVIAALITTMATAAALLSSSIPALASPTPPAPNSALFGTWVNTNPATDNIKYIVITPSGDGILVDQFGACHNGLCEAGNIPGTVFGANVSSATEKAFEANWTFAWGKRNVLLGTLGRARRLPISVLTVQEFNIFTDHSYRGNYARTETFVRAGTPLSPAKNGTAASDYPLGDPIISDPSRPGVWSNISSTGGIEEIILTLGPGGLLEVSPFGNCVPAWCAWGKVAGITFGTWIFSPPARTFLAFYHFGFANKLLVGTLNATGTGLTVQTYTEFTDHSGPFQLSHHRHVHPLSGRRGRAVPRDRGQLPCAPRGRGPRSSGSVSDDGCGGYQPRPA